MQPSYRSTTTERIRTPEHAEQLVSLFPVGAEIRTGVTVIATEVFEVSAVADR